MNKYQKIYCDIYYNGKMPKTKIGKEEFNLLGKCENFVTVNYGEKFGNKVETYWISDECNMPEGKIDVHTLASNLRFWTFKGFEIIYG